MTDTAHSFEQDRYTSPTPDRGWGRSPDGRLPTWLLVVTGLISLAAGVLAFAWPGVTLAALAVLVGVAVLVDGIGALVDGVVGPPGSGRLGRALVGLLGIVVGLVALRSPGLTLLVLAFVTGVWVVCAGVVALAEAWTDGAGARGVRTFTAVIEIVAGVLVLAWPAVGLGTFVLLIGLALCVRGITAIVVALASADRSQQLS